MKCEEIKSDDVFVPLVMSPMGKVPLIGATMTDEREREIANRYPAESEESA